jgi:cytochrome c
MRELRESDMKFTLSAIAATVLMTAPAFAAGDAAKGEANFKQCQACHMVADDTGAVLAGKGKTGPNLYGVFGRQAGSYPEFKYGESIVAAGAAGLVWNEAEFIAYVQDPAAYLKEKLGDKGAKSKMAFKVKDEAAAADLYAYLSQFSPAAAAAPAQ